ncbi:MAG TPA: F0F1 ATP synthase subunit A, partial [Candidatus Acidoferrum sp.]|nr:F0F1 ATP synthase subunit A [Candidatus Acidoferrum sp.]
MRNRCLLMSILAVASSAMLATSTFAAEAGATEHAGVSLKPQMLVQFGGFGITNSMLVTWIVAASIIIFSQIATRRVRAIPTGIQNFWEWLVEGLHNFLENIIGRELVAKGFWFFATVFIFILFVNWFGLIPGIGTIGWGHYGSSGNFHVDRPLLRGGNADLNMTTAMSAIFFVMWFVWAIQANGVGGFLKHLFGPKGETSGIVRILMIVIFFAVGWLEVISILFRPIALSFRLFGNIYAGESILEAMSTMIPWLS